MLKDAALTIASDAEGASNVDYNDRLARINGVTHLLCDYVYEWLLDDGVTYGTVIDVHVFRLIEQLVASAMIAQYDEDAKQWGKVITDIVNHDGRLSPKE